MTHRVRLVSEGKVYHVTARGVGRQIIFERDDDRQDFVDSMWKIKGNAASRSLCDKSPDLLSHDLLSHFCRRELP